jgi:hypothetical protein
MLYHSRLITALEEKRAEFVSFERALRGEVREAAARLRSLGGAHSVKIRERVASHRGSRVTYPSAELDERRSVVVPFEPVWRSHEEARAWAFAVLAGRTTFAADGSQIYPGREVSMPVGAVQVASFENPHAVGVDYVKEAHFRVVSPGELLEHERAYESPDQIIGLKRFELEAETIRAFLERKKNWRARGERMPVAFLDGTLLISSRRKGTEMLFFKAYAEALTELVLASREAEVPVVGYIDQSFAPDLRDLIEALDPSVRQTNVYDAQLLRAATQEDAGAPLLRAWGDRTIFWHCQRANLADKFYDEHDAPVVGFVYMQTTAEGYPARLDVPAWVYEAGLLEETVDTVRAECVVGNGYPYAIETADAAAVMTARDREQFLRVMQDFAAREKFDFRIARKASSKARRR